MGLIISRFRKKQSTEEVLEQIQQDILQIEEYGAHTQQRQKRLVGSLVLYSSIFYLIAVAVFYFYYFPSQLQDRLLYATPFIIFPFLIYLLKRLLSWYYRRKITKNELKLKSLREKKEKILEQVMETEPYKKAKKILETYGSDQLKKTQLTPSVLKSQPIPTPAQRMPSPSQHSGELRRRPVNSVSPSQAASHPVGIARPQVPSMVMHQTTGFPPRAPMMGQNVPARPGPNPANSGNANEPPGPPMPRPVLPRERGYFDRFVEYLVGDGPANRFALVCRQCESHNGMALKDEFPYLAFRCAYCYYWNPARKQRPCAPRLEDLTPLPPSSLAEPDQEEEDEDDDDDELEDEQEEQSLSGEEDEDEEDDDDEEDEEGGMDEEESGGTSSGEEGAVSSSEQSSNKATSSQEGSLEDVAKSTPSSVTSSDPSTSEEHLQQQQCNANSTTASSTNTTTPSSTTENEETE